MKWWKKLRRWWQRITDTKPTVSKRYNMAIMDDPEINPPAPKGKLKGWYGEVIIDRNNKGQMIVINPPALSEAIRKGRRITVSVEGVTK